MARSRGSTNRPDTLAQDQPHHRRKPLATHGRSIHWVISRHCPAPASCLLYPRKQTFVSASGMSAKCHVWTAPCWQGFSSRLQRWSVQPCVRPVCAVHMTAGHNALRGSGPGQNPAFEDALAHMGCPDRRIDRLCITCCSPSPTFISRRIAGVISFTPPARQVPCSAHPWPSSPTPFWRSCWPARSRRPWSAAEPATL